MDELSTPEEIAAGLRNRITATFIRKLVTRREVECTRGPRRMVLFTPDQKDALIRYLAEAPKESTGPGTFRATSRSASRRRGGK